MQAIAFGDVINIKNQMRTKMKKKGCLIVSMAFLMLSGLYEIGRAHV